VPDAVKRLTPRELEVVRAIAHGKFNSEVGAELYLSEPTVPGSIVRRRDRLCATPLNQAAPTFTGKGCIGMRHR
jgi:DNA-binding NarL/FixJ family response regulator